MAKPRLTSEARCAIRGKDRCPCRESRDADCQALARHLHSAAWSSGMILAQGVRGPGFNSHPQHVSVRNPSDPIVSHFKPQLSRAGPPAESRTQPRTPERSAATAERGPKRTQQWHRERDGGGSGAVGRARPLRFARWTQGFILFRLLLQPIVLSNSSCFRAEIRPAKKAKNGVAQWLACWAHNPKVRRSQPRSAKS